MTILVCSRTLILDGYNFESSIVICRARSQSKDASITKKSEWMMFFKDSPLNHPKDYHP